MKKIRSLLHFFRRIVIRILKWILVLIPKKKNLVLFNSWFGSKYDDNSRYVYEYMLKNQEIEIYWVTKDEKVYSTLKNRGIPVLKMNSFKQIWYQIRAKILVATIGLDDFNQFFLSKCIYINLWHGIPLKEIEYDIYHYSIPANQTKADKRMIKYLDLLRVGIEEYIASTSLTVGEIYKKAFRFPNKNVVSLGQPRNDVFYNSELRKNVNLQIENIKNDRKAIVYMPTHRECGKIPIKVSEIIDLEKINEICIEKNCVFLIKKHFYHRNENENVEMYDNIFDISNQEVNSQVLLYQADILVTDYSGCYYDYLLLNRPIIFYSYDLDSYLKKQRNMYFNYKDRICGPQCNNSFEFTECIIECFNEYDSYKNKRETLRDGYYSKENQKEVIPRVSQFILEKLGRTEIGRQKL